MFSEYPLKKYKLRKRRKHGFIRYNFRSDIIYLGPWGKDQTTLLALSGWLESKLNKDFLSIL